MAVSSISEHLSCSFFLINSNHELLFFRLNQFSEIQHFIAGIPTVGCNIEAIITQKYKYQFLKLISKCFEGNCFCTEVEFKTKESLEICFKLVFTPIAENDVKYVVCTIIYNDQNASCFNTGDDHYPQFSQRLRKSTTNLLKLLNIAGHTPAKFHNLLKINELLANINLQTGKLENLIEVLYPILNQTEIIPPSKIKHLKTEKQHIVLVDDDIITSKIHQRLIKNHCSEKQIVVFDKPGSALDYIKRNNPDLIFLDLHMPEIDGLKFLQILNDHQILIDVIIVSSSVDPNERLLAKSYNFVKEFITKPLTHEKVKIIFNN